MDTSGTVRPYAIGLFDVLGFKSRFDRCGIRDVAARYASLADVVRQKNEELAQRLTYFPTLREGPYWCAGGEILAMTQVHAAYASDSFLVWAHHTWTDHLQRSDAELEELAKDPAHDWLFRPVPCDALLEACNELLCRSLEVDLPLRGALAVGDAILDRKRTTFLGAPIIEANAMEKRQAFIGAGMCASFAAQQIPARFQLPFCRQLKSSSLDGYSGSVLDWPLHWRRMRTSDLRKVISGMDTQAECSAYYENTLASVSVSDGRADQFEVSSRCPIRTNYEQFSYERNENIAAHAIAVRRLTPAPT
jgi:hypothetical protein